MKYEQSYTNRGYVLLEFKDENGQKCSLQKSSAGEPDKIWLGCDENAEPHHVTQQIGKPRMHLTQEHAKWLINELQYFVETGELNH